MAFVLFFILFSLVMDINIMFQHLIIDIAGVNIFNQPQLERPAMSIPGPHLVIKEIPSVLAMTAISEKEKSHFTAQPSIYRFFFFQT